MNYLLSGGYNPKKLDLLLGLTSIKSDDIKSAIRTHLINGASVKAAAELNSVDSGNLQRAIKRLNEAATSVELIKEIDFSGIKKCDCINQVALVTKGKAKKVVFDPLSLVTDEINFSAWSEWVDFRKQSRKRISKAAASKQLKLLADYPIDVQAEIINTSISNDYQGLFAPKGFNNARQVSNASNSHAQRSAGDTASLLALAESLEVSNGFMGEDGPALSKQVDSFGGASCRGGQAEPQFQLVAEEDGTFIDRAIHARDGAL